MRRTILLVTSLALTLLVASRVARIGGLRGNDGLLGDSGKDVLLEVLQVTFA